MRLRWASTASRSVNRLTVKRRKGANLKEAAGYEVSRPRCPFSNLLLAVCVSAPWDTNVSALGHE